MPVEINVRLLSSLEVFKALQRDNDLLKDDNIDHTFKSGLSIFAIGKPIRELLVEGPIEWEGELWDFEYHYGLRSLVRRGFYQINGDAFIRDIPNLRTGTEVPTWSAEVLFCPHRQFDTIFKFLANVGPLINQDAVGFNFSNFGPQIINGGSLKNQGIAKGAFLRHMLNKTFYVTQQCYVDTFYKQTAWFKIE